MLRFLAVASASLLCACAHFRCPRQGGPEWREVASDHFIVRTDLTEAQARTRIAEMELTRSALTAAWPVAPSEERFSVLLPRDAAEMGEFARDDRERERGLAYEGFFGGQHLVLDGARPAFQQRELKRAIGWAMIIHELKRAPLWLWSGLLDHLESVEIDAASLTVLVGAPHLEGAYYAKKVGLVAVDDVVRWAPDIRYTVGFRESAWALVHTLVSEHPSELGDLLARLSAGEDPARAWQTAAGKLPSSQLEAEIRKELGGTSVSVFRRSIPALRVAVSSQPLADGALHALRAEAIQQGLINDARRHGLIGLPMGAVRNEVAEALAEDATDPLALALDLRATAQDRLARAKAATERRVQDYRSPLLVWALLYQLASDQSALAAPDLDWLLSRYLAKDRAPMTADMAQAIERAAAIAPDALYPAAGKAALLLSRNEAAGALDAAERARRLNPTSPLLMDLHAAALAQSGRCDEAAAEQRLALAHTADLKAQQGPIFYGHIRETAGERMLEGMRERLREYQERCGKARAAAALER